jgi:hypothetical protein
VVTSTSIVAARTTQAIQNVYVVAARVTMRPGAVLYRKSRTTSVTIV